MGGYADFAAFYDRLTDDVGYPQRADYIAELLMEHGMKKGIVLDQIGRASCRERV